MNHCPVYHAIGGHAYGWVYPGPMGAVLTPTLIGVDKGGNLPNASTFCGRCESVCPMRIPLPKMMRHWREKEFERHLQATPALRPVRLALLRPAAPALYRLASRAASGALRLIGRSGRRAGSRPCRLPAAGPTGATCRPQRRAARSWPLCQGEAPVMSARDAILSRVRRSGGSVASDPTRRAAVADRLQRAPRGVVPARAQLGDEERVALFMAKAEAVQAAVVRLDDAAKVPAAVADYLRRHNLPQRYAWARIRGFPPSIGRASRSFRSPKAEHGVGSGLRQPCGGRHRRDRDAGAGVRPDNPTTLNFLPDHHIVVVDAEGIVGDPRKRFRRCPRPLWRGTDAADAELRQRPVAFGRHRTDAAARRPRSEKPLHHRRRLGTGWLPGR